MGYFYPMNIRLIIFLLCLIIADQSNAQSRLVLPVMHNGRILSMDENLEKELIITGDAKGVIKVWELSSGKEIYTLNHHDDDVVYVKFFDEGKVFLSADAKGNIALFNTQKGELLDSIALGTDINGAWRTSEKECVLFSDTKAGIIELSADAQIQLKQTIPGKWASFSPEESSTGFHSAMGPLDLVNKRVLTLNNSRSKLFLKDWQEGKSVQQWEWPDENIQTAEFSPDGKFIFVGMIENRWKIIDAKSSQMISENKNFAGAVLDFSFHPTLKRVLVTSDDHVCREFDYEKGELLFSKKMDGPVSGNIAAFYSDKGQYKLITDFTEDCLVLNSISNEEQYQYHEKFEEHHMVATSVDEKYLYVFHPRFWRKIDLQKGKDVFLHSFSPFSVLNKFEGRHDWLVSSTYGRVFITDKHTGKNIYEGKYLTKSMTTSLLHEGKEMLILGGNDKILSWNYKQEDSLQLRVSNRMGEITCLRWNKDSTSFFASALDRKVVQYNLKDFKPIREFRFDAIGQQVVCFEVIEEQNLLVMVGEDNAIHFYEFSSGKLIQKFETKSPVLFQSKLNHRKDELIVTSPLGLSILYAFPSMEIKFNWSTPGNPSMGVDFSSEDRYVIIAKGSNDIWMMDCRTGELVKKFQSHTATVFVADFSHDDRYIVSTSPDTRTIVWDVQTAKPLYSRINLLSVSFGLNPVYGQYLLYDEWGRFEGTEKGRDRIYMSCGLEIIELSQLKDALYVPGLVEKIMSGQPILYPKLSELEICGTLPLIEKTEDAPYHYTITPRKLGIKRVEVYVNGKRVMMKSPEELNKKEEHYEWNIDEKEIQRFFVPGEENQVKVIGIVQQGNNEMQSRGVVEEVEPTKEEKQHPTFYGLMVGVSDYKDDRLDLKYPTKDSKDLGKVMESAAKKLLNTTTENHVKMYYVNSEVKGENGYSTPEREGVKKALQAISKEARAEDVVMIFFAGHGVMEGDKDKRFTFLTAESTKENLVGISTKDLEEWMSGTNGYLPNKTILIFDACNSGQATEELMAMARDDEETQRIRQVEDLKDKSGMFIMSASAANQSAYELPRYGHGLLTYSLLKTLKTSSSTLDEERFINVQKWFLETETTMDNLTRELGVKQEAQPFGRGNIRVGELDEEIRGGIEIQQEKPMVYCANALNLDTDDDDWMLKSKFNDYLKNYQTRGEAKVMLAMQEVGSIKVNFKYNLESDGQIQCLSSIFKKSVKEQINWKGNPADLERFFEQVLLKVE